MDNTFAWRFEDSSLWFVSTPETINKHINKARRDLEIHPDTKIIYKDARFTPPYLSDIINSVSDIPVTPVAKTKRNNSIQTNNVSDVSDVVGDTFVTPTPLPTPTPDGDPGSGNFGPGL